MTPIVPSPFPYVTGLQVSYLSNTTLSVAAGQARDSTDTFDIALSATTTLNATANGLNGLDTGSFAANTMYAIHVIADSANFLPTGVIMSLSATAPTLPFGYSGFKQIGWWASDGSTHFFIGYTTGNGSSRSFWYDTKQSVLSGGTQTSTFLAFTLANIVPAVAFTPVLCEVSFTPATAGDSVSFRPTGSSATSVQTISSVVASKAQIVQAKLLSNLATGAPKIDYENSAASGATSVAVTGFDFFV